MLDTCSLNLSYWQGNDVWHIKLQNFQYEIYYPQMEGYQDILA